MASFSDLLKSGWSTSKAGDMKNPGGAPVEFAKRETEKRPNPFAASAEMQMRMERRQREMEAQRDEFASKLKVEKDRERREMITVADEFGNVRVIPADGKPLFAGAATAAAMSKTTNAEKLNQMMQALKINGGGMDATKLNLDAFSKLMTASEQQRTEKPNPDRPQSDIDAW